MGWHSEIGIGDWEDSRYNSCKAHHVGISPKKDCSGTTGEMGEDQGSEEEGGLISY
jgi:hypothetical protein